jgi:hypothetical protein
MPRTVRVTEQDLRGAMRDERYWRSGHPERAAFVGWVTDGFRGLYPADGAARGAVWVRTYVRNGHPVAAHWRSAPPGGGRADDTSGTGRSTGGAIDEGEAKVIPANWRSIFRRGPDRAPADRGSGGGAPGPQGRGRNPRRSDAEGRDPVDDLRGQPNTRRGENLRDRVDEWHRSGGEAGRAQDLERLRPVGPPTVSSDGVQTYRLQDGHMATVRPSTSPGSNGVPTLEIAEPTDRPGRLRPTDKFRYPPTR